MSKLNVNAIEPSTGTDIVLGASGDTTTVPSGATLDISSATLTPPATMPASSGVNLTALNASNLGSGTVPTARLGTGTASSSTVLYGDQTYKAEPGGGITASSQWRLATSFTGQASPIASNWELGDTQGYASLGSDMTESSGEFTFPSTGYWLITFQLATRLSGDSRYNNASLYTTTNSGTNWTIAAMNGDGFAQSGSALTYSSSIAIFQFDVTNVSTHLVRFESDPFNTSTTTLGATANNQTCVTFTRLGDT